MIHVEYDLLFTNTFASPVTLKTIDVTDISGTLLMRLEGARLSAATQNVFDQKVISEIPASGSAAVEVDLILEPGTVPERLSRRVWS